MDVRLSPLTVAIGLLFATVSPALALVHQAQPDGIVLRDASGYAKGTARPQPGGSSTASAAPVTARSAVARPEQPWRRPRGLAASHSSKRRRHARPRNLHSKGRTGFSRPASDRRVGPDRRLHGKPTGRGVTPSPLDAATLQNVAADARWILQAQLPDGAIANYIDQQAIWPYLSNFAAMGLARATEVTGDGTFAAASWRWLHWYQARQDGSGFVTDYKVVGGTPVSTGDMDSTDAYAGTFLMAVRGTYQATQNSSQLASLRPGIVGALRAIEATQDSDGLTWAKPAWHVKYAMDQAETYGGLVAAAAVANTLGDSALANRASSDATRMRNGFAKLWDPATGAYDWAVHDDGYHHPTDWSVLYPDALQQAWVVAFGLADPSHAKTLVSHFTKAHPQWDQPASTDRYDTGTAPVGYWAPAGWALGQVSPSATPDAAQSIRQAALASGRAWPFTPSDAGQLIVLETWNASGTSSVPTRPVRVS